MECENWGFGVCINRPLMESRLGNSDGAEIPKKTRSLDLKSLYKSKISMESEHSKDIKRKISSEDGDNKKSYKRKKISKTVSISSLKNVDNSKRSVGEVYNGVVSSGSYDLKDSKLGLNHDSTSGFNGISFSLDDSAIRIPKRKRDFVGRKKVEVSQVLKPRECTCSKVSITDPVAKVTGDDSATGDNSPRDLDPQVESSKDLGERFEPPKVKCKKSCDDSKENRNSEMNSARYLKEEGENSNHLVVNHGESSLKKEKRNSESNLNRYPKGEGGCATYQVAKYGDSSSKKPHRVRNSSLAECVKEEDGGVRHSEVNKSDSSLKKPKRNSSKRKESVLDKRRVAKESKPLKDSSVKTHDNLLEDEENLEENAAMMLSSRFNPSCTGFSSNGKSVSSTNGLSFLLSSERDFGSHESSLLDAAGRALRPRIHHKERGHSRKRRHYYEILSGDLNGYWVLNRRIKVFWPLDRCWYYGLVVDYDKEKKLHHVKYDDRDEEWINLENERYKLLLLPSEFPGKAGRRRSRARERSVDEGKGSLKSSKEKEKGNLTTEVDDCVGNMDSEPIISWLARSTHRVKSSPFPATKKQKKSDRSLTSEPPFGTDEVENVSGCLDAGSRNNSLSSKPKLLDRFIDGGRGEESVSESPSCSKDSKRPIVYYRRRFCKTGGSLFSTSSGNYVSGSTPPSVSLLAPSIDGSLGLEEHDIYLQRHAADGALLSTGYEGVSRLKDSRQVRFELSFPISSILNQSFGAENLWMFHAVFLLHYGTLITSWPSVHLEMLFVDNIVGLRYFLFEGCLKKAVACVFLVLTLFHQPKERGKCADPQLPVTSIRFKFSCIQNLSKQFVFAFYNFAEVKNSTWMCMDFKLKRQCLFTWQLPLSECTHDNIKALQDGGNWLTTSVCWDGSSTKGLRRMSRQGISLKDVSRESTSVKVIQFSSNLDKKRRNLPPFVVSFTAAPTFFISLHLKLLMEHSMSFHGRDSTERPQSDDSSLADDSCSLEYCLSKDSECTCENSASESTHDTGVKVMPKKATSDGCLPVGKLELEAVSPSVCGNGHGIRSPRTYGNGDLIVAGTSASSQDPEEIGSEAITPLQNWQGCEPKSEQHASSPRPSDDCDKTDTAYHSPLNGNRVEIPTFDQFEKHVDREYPSAQRSMDSNWNMNGVIVQSPNPTAPRSAGHQNRSSSSSFGYLPHGWSDGKSDHVHNNFGNGPKKPRTQVSYSLPFQGFDYSSKNRNNHQKTLPYTRIRRANEKRLSNVCRGSKKKLELLSCDANVLITLGDKGWRECGAQIILEVLDHNEWKLAVKLSGSTRYSYKAHQFLQPGSTNRYTHAMMWKGGKDWTLEFLDRSQWAIFKEMHEECYNRNVRAASVKHIPIPGVRLIEESDDNGAEVAFARSSSKYFRQVETDAEMALDPSRVLYDMDSDDERCILKIHSSLEADNHDLWDISEELFEKTMDTFEKAAYSQQRDQFTYDEIEELMTGVGSMEGIKLIYEHWRQRRQKKGMPLIRHLQLPLWESYQQQLKEWELAVSKTNSTLLNGCQGKVATIEKPPMFAFCLKPRGLEVPNRGSKQRSHRKISVSGKSNTITGDHDVFQTFGRRLNGFSLGDEKFLYPGHNNEYLDDSPLSWTSPRGFSPRLFSPCDTGSVGYFSMNSDRFDRNQYQKLQRSKSKKFGMFESSYDTPMVASYNQRLMSKRNGIHWWNLGYSEWPSHRHFYLDGSPRHGLEQLDCSDLDEFRLRDATGATQHARNMAKLKREKAQRLLYRADLAIHKAVNSLLIAEAIKGSFDDINSDGWNNQMK